MSEGRTRSAAPQLIFDDGSRIITESLDSPSAILSDSPRGSVPISRYYEIDRLSKEIVSLVRSSSQKKNEDQDKWLVRVALQFPDDLLQDSPQVCWEMENSLLVNYYQDHVNTHITSSEIENSQQEKAEDSSTNTETTEMKKFPLVFCLGDTTFGPCCPDEISALHLDADVLVHYGHACLSPALSLPVLYGFGISDDFDVEACVKTVLSEVGKQHVKRLLLLYQVRYHHAMGNLQIQLTERGEVSIVSGKIPQPVEKSGLGVETTTTTITPAMNSTIDTPMMQTCCSPNSTNSTSCTTGGAISSSCTVDKSDCSRLDGSNVATQTNGITQNEERHNAEENSFLIGGLELPENLDLSSFTVLFIGESGSHCRQYVNSMLRFISCPQRAEDDDNNTSGGPPERYWTYSPATAALETSLPSYIQRQLNRRFYLIQKARDASVFGILVGTLSQRHFRLAVSSLRTMIKDADRACYTFAIGKVNPAKLANFADIECYILVACAENSILENERDIHVPVITPLELKIALGYLEWGEQAYSSDYNDFLRLDSSGDEAVSSSTTAQEKTDPDEPYFSLVTGKYETSKKQISSGVTIDLTNLPGQGQLTTYKSEAAEFLKQRAYKGLETQAGETEIHAAVPGLQGIASDYGQR